MRVQVLDHGYLEEVEHYGSDERIVEAARMSTGKGFLGWDPGPCPVCGGKGILEDTYDVSPPVCYGCDGKGTVAGDLKLLSYLYSNHHDTPFEMAGLIIEVQAPIFVFREWHRHRTQCITGDSKITCMAPRAKAYTRTIKEIFDLKYGGVVDKNWKTKNGLSKAGTPLLRDARLKHKDRIRVLPNCQERELRVLNENEMEFTSLPMKDVWESGIKPVYLLKVGTKLEIKATKNHRFLTKDGWKKLDQLKVGDCLATSAKIASNESPFPPSLRAGIGVWTSMMRQRIIKDEDKCYICLKCFSRDNLELDHVIPVKQDIKLALDTENLMPACMKCHREKTNTEQGGRSGQTKLGVKWIKLTENPKFLGSEMTYDIEVNGDHHNFIANNFIVHNSYNEMSARYVPLPDINYMPTVERLMINSKSNKQAGVIKGATELTELTAFRYQNRLKQHYTECQGFYEEALNLGIPKELARIHLPVGRYSRMRASANLRNWLAFMTLRMAPGAQYEIRMFANEVSKVIARDFPRTYELFCAGRK